MTPEEIAQYRHALTFRLVDLAPFDALVAELEQARKERDQARGNWSDVPPHNRLISIAEWQRIVTDRDATLGRILDKLDSFRAKAAALDAIEQWLRGEDFRFIEASAVVGEGEVQVTLEEHCADPDGGQVVSQCAGDTLADAIMAAIEKAKEMK